MAHIPRHGSGTNARISSLDGGPATTHTGASPVFVDGSGRRSRQVRGITGLLLLVLLVFALLAVDIVKSATDAPVRWVPGPGAQTVKLNP